MTDKKEIECLFKANYAGMYRLAVALLHDQEGARDLVHDVFADLLDSGNCTVGAGYLLRTVRNRCLNRIRDAAVRERLANRWFLDNSEYDQEDWPDEETLRLMSRLLRTEISERAAKVIDLRFRKGLPFEKVAMTMGISQSAVFRHLSKALAILRNKMNPTP